METQSQIVEGGWEKEYLVELIDLEARLGGLEAHQVHEEGTAAGSL